MTSVEAHYHPFLFTAMLLVGMTELGLTSFLIDAGNENGTWPRPRYHSLLIMICFNAAWTTLFSAAYFLFYQSGGRYFLANVASSVIWLLITTALWAISTGLMHHTRTGGDCARRALISRCRQSLTVEALGWTELGLCVIALILTCAWMWSERWRRKVAPAHDVEVGSQTKLVLDGRRD